MSDDGQESATSTNADVMGEVLQGRMLGSAGSLTANAHRHLPAAYYSV